VKCDEVAAAAEGADAEVSDGAAAETEDLAIAENAASVEIEASAATDEDPGLAASETLTVNLAMIRRESPFKKFLRRIILQYVRM
jgi:hypothetical protein